MQQKIYDLLLNEEEISWRTIIYDLVKSEQMDPWDINITLLTQKYIETIRQMQEHDLKISGKIVLAAAVLLKIKSSHLVNNDFSKFDSLLNQHDDLEEIEEELYDQIEGVHSKKYQEQYGLIPRNPQPRNRKVSVNDLVEALQRAMTSKKRILERMKPVKFNFPKSKIDIMEVIRDVLHKIQYYTKKDNKKEIDFSRLLPPKASKEDKVYTFLPLLHLENQQKLIMRQTLPFSEINISLNNGKKANKANSP